MYPYLHTVCKHSCIHMAITPFHLISWEKQSKTNKQKILWHREATEVPVGLCT